MNIKFDKLCINLFVGVYWIISRCVLQKLIVCISKLSNIYHLIMCCILINAISKNCESFYLEMYIGMPNEYLAMYILSDHILYTDEY